MSDSIATQLGHDVSVYPEVEPRCCICHPELRIDAHLCHAHKIAGLDIASRESIRFVEAADRMYWEAREHNAIS